MASLVLLPAILGSTSRLEAVAHLEFLRDTSIPLCCESCNRASALKAYMARRRFKRDARKTSEIALRISIKV